MLASPEEQIYGHSRFASSRLNCTTLNQLAFVLRKHSGTRHSFDSSSGPLTQQTSAVFLSRKDPLTEIK